MNGPVGLRLVSSSNSLWAVTNRSSSVPAPPWDRPGPVIFLHETGTTRMSQQDLQNSILDAVHQQTGTEARTGERHSREKTTSSFRMTALICSC